MRSYRLSITCARMIKSSFLLVNSFKNVSSISYAFETFVQDALFKPVQTLLLDGMYNNPSFCNFFAVSKLT